MKTFPLDISTVRSTGCNQTDSCL